MKEINLYIYEKLKISKDVKFKEEKINFKDYEEFSSYIKNNCEYYNLKYKRFKYYTYLYYKELNSPIYMILAHLADENVFSCIDENGGVPPNAVDGKAVLLYNNDKKEDFHIDDLDFKSGSEYDLKSNSHNVDLLMNTLKKFGEDNA